MFWKLERAAFAVRSKFRRNKPIGWPAKWLTFGESSGMLSSFSAWGNFVAVVVALWSLRREIIWHDARVLWAKIHDNQLPNGNKSPPNTVSTYKFFHFAIYCLTISTAISAMIDIVTWQQVSSYVAILKLHIIAWGLSYADKKLLSTATDQWYKICSAELAYDWSIVT